MRRTELTLALAVAWAALPPIGTYAQEPGTGTSSAATEQAPAIPRIGPLVIGTDVAVSQGYDDNVFATRNDKIADFVTVIAPSLELEARQDRGLLRLFGDAEIGRYWDETSEDYEDYAIGGEGRVSIAPTANLFGGTTYLRDHEERESPDDVGGRKPTTYDALQGFGGVAARFDRVTTRLGGTVEDLDFGDVEAAQGSINNDDRDRTVSTVGTRLGYFLTLRHEVFGQVALDHRDYDSDQDDFGFARDSFGGNAAVGLRYRPSSNLDVEVLAGWLVQDYEDSELEDPSAPDLGALLEWQLPPQTELTLFLDRSIEETTVPGASSYLSTGAGASVRHFVTSEIELGAGIAIFQNDYQGIGRDDRVSEVSLDGRWYFADPIFVGASYLFRQRDSDEPEDDYDDNQMFLTLGGAIGRDRQQAEVPPASFDPGGLYFGAQLGFTALTTDLDGARGQGGGLTADFADHEPGGGVFTGYGLALGDWRFSLEADVETSAVDWRHARTPGGREFSVDKNTSVGIGPVIGYRLRSGAMLYGRAGAVWSEFETDYDAMAGSDQRKSWEGGLRVGGGVEVPVAAGNFLRLDFSRTSYADYDAGPTPQDNFATSEQLFRLGFGHRFGETETFEPPSADFDGWYLGVQGGFGTMTTQVTGPREAGSTLDASYGDEGGAAGMFGGYARSFGDAVVAAEAEADLASQTVDLKRDPTGRVWSVDNNGTLGAGVRAGWAFGEAAMVYGRIGGVITQFRTKYAFRGTQERSTDFQPGVRVGLGAEVPMSDRIFTRLDYTFTRYSDKEISYGPGLADEFDHEESLARVGLGYRF